MTATSCGGHLATTDLGLQLGEGCLLAALSPGLGPGFQVRMWVENNSAVFPTTKSLLLDAAFSSCLGILTSQPHVGQDGRLGSSSGQPPSSLEMRFFPCRAWGHLENEVGTWGRTLMLSEGERQMMGNEQYVLVSCAMCGGRRESSCNSRLGGVSGRGL